MQFTVMPEDKARSILAAETAKNVEEARQRAVQARQGANDMRVLRDLLKGFKGGAIDQWKSQLGRYLPADTLKGIATAGQISESIRLKASNAFRMPGQVSNYEQQTYLAAVPGLMWYEQGRDFMADYADKLASRASKLSAFESKMLRDNGWVDQEALDAYDQSLGPVFTEEERQVMFGAARTPVGELPPSSGAQRPTIPPWVKERK
jgi:hypothetical protein